MTPEERHAQYEAYAKRYMELKAELIALAPHKTEPECGNRALIETDEEFKALWAENEKRRLQWRNATTD
jgi:hypothetical protein